MAVEKTLIKLGFDKDEDNAKLNEVFKDNIKLKEIHIDIYPDNPMLSSSDFTLLLRTHEDNVIVSNDGIRLILKKCNKYETHFMNILFSNITECFSKVSGSCCEFILNVQNIYYKITILN